MHKLIKPFPINMSIMAISILLFALLMIICFIAPLTSTFLKGIEKADQPDLSHESQKELVSLSDFPDGIEMFLG